jgi:hypothetical protein
MYSLNFVGVSLKVQFLLYRIRIFFPKKASWLTLKAIVQIKRNTLGHAAGGAVV